MWLGIGGLAIGWSAFIVMLEITSSLDGMFDASLHADVIRRSYSGGSAMPPGLFLGIVAAFALSISWASFSICGYRDITPQHLILTLSCCTPYSDAECDIGCGMARPQQSVSYQ